jgi:crossover junction endodeoxyribonuclease RusA
MGAPDWHRCEDSCACGGCDHRECVCEAGGLGQVIVTGATEAGACDDLAHGEVPGHESAPSGPVARRWIAVDVPAPAAWINSNARPHWAERARLTSAWRWAARNAARGVWDGFGGRPVDVTCWVRKSSHRSFDAHNLMPTVKACIDGLVQAGVLEDDSNDHVRAVTILAGPVASRDRIAIRIEECE